MSGNPVPEPRGLPARIYVPILLAIAVVFLGTLGYFIAVGLGVSGAVLGSGRASSAAVPDAPSVQGGPPAPVMEELAGLRARIAAHPNDDVALTELADNYLAVNKFNDAIPLYERALKANPRNVAAKAGLEEARADQARNQP